MMIRALMAGVAAAAILAGLGEPGGPVDPPPVAANAALIGINELPLQAADCSSTTPWVPLVTGGGPVSITGASAHNSGPSFAAGDIARPMWGQEIILDEASLAKVQAGGCQVVFKALRAGWTDTDTGGLWVRAYDASDNLVYAAYQTRWDPNGTYVYRQDGMDGLLPTNTVKLMVGAYGNRASGTELSTYFDEFELYLSRQRYTESYPVFFEGPTNATGWTPSAGSTIAFVSNSASVAYDFVGLSLESQDFPTMTKVWDLPTEAHARIDTGELEAQWEWYALQFAGGADGYRMELDWLDATDAVLGTISSGAEFVVPTEAGNPERFSGMVPAGARKARVTYFADRNSGSNSDAYVNHMSLQLRTSDVRDEHRYWRIYCTGARSNINTNYGIAEVEFVDDLGNPIRHFGETFSASGTYGGAEVASAAFDYNIATRWASPATGGIAWLQCTFAQAKKVAGCKVRARQDNPQECPTRFQLQYSDDGTTWTDLFSTRTALWLAGEQRQFSTADRWWRVNITAVENTLQQVNLSNVEFRPLYDQPYIVGRGWAFAKSAWSSTENPPRAFDGDDATHWGTGPSTSYLDTDDRNLPQYIGYANYGRHQCKQLVMRTRNGGQDTAPINFTLDYSDDCGTTWVTARAVTGVPLWYDGQTRLFDADPLDRGEDPHFQNVALLLSSRSGTITDVARQCTVTPFGGATVEPIASPVGASGMRFGQPNNQGVSDYVDVIMPSRIPRNGPFTLEGWFYRQAQVDNWMGWYGNTTSQFANRNAVGEYMHARLNGQKRAHADQIVPLDTWTHVAFTRDALNVVRCFIDGVLQTSVEGSVDVGYALPASFWIGRASTAGDNSSWNGLLDEIRLTLGVDRYGAANFSPPTDRYFAPTLSVRPLDLSLVGLETARAIEDKGPVNVNFVAVETARQV